MAAFIVISTDNRLHYLVDGIEKCRPLNSDANTCISIGKIKCSESDGFTYEYSVSGKDLHKETGAVSLSNLLANQFANIRKKSDMGDSPLNIFLLENPLNEQEKKCIDYWLKGFYTVYGSTKGSSTNFRLFHVFMTYSLDNPTDVNKQIDKKLLQDFIENHRKNIEKRNGGDTKIFDQFIFYIDNQDCNDAALCLDKADHDLKMPRYLADVMMLVSNVKDAYGVMNAIKGVSCNTQCFSVGYAESMYYYPDVKHYFAMADQRNLLNEILTQEDEAAELKNDVNAMNIKRHPWGLRKRNQRLSSVYADVPFTDDIELYPNSVDKKIENYLRFRRNWLEARRNEEIREYEAAKKTAEDSGEPMTAPLPTCPEYIDRQMIYTSLSEMDEEDIEKKVEVYKCRYWDLINYVNSNSEAKSPVIYSDSNSSKEPGSELGEKEQQSTELSQNRGCLSRLFPWRKKVKSSSIDDEDKSRPQPSATVETDINIGDLLDLKRRYKDFKAKLDEIEADYEKTKTECDNFKLTKHSNSWFFLIDFGKLKQEQDNTFNARLDQVRKEPIDKSADALSILKSKMKQVSGEYTKEYAFINWEKPFTFVKKLSTDDLKAICDKLQGMSAPFVNYNITTETQEDRVVRCFYSDRPNIEEEFKTVKGSIKQGGATSVYCFSHIASKLCMMQFLPMDEDILSNLVDLYEPEDSSEVE